MENENLSLCAEIDRINEKWAEEKETFIGIISDLEAQIKQLTKEEETEAEDPEEEDIPVGVSILENGLGDHIMEQGGGTLMFPSQYRKVCSSDINWAQIRKKYDLTGRGWNLYIETNPEIKKQNKEVKYKHPHFVEKDWDGAYLGDFNGLYVSDYVYGDVYIVRK